MNVAKLRSAYLASIAFLSLTVSAGQSMEDHSAPASDESVDLFLGLSCGDLDVTEALLDAQIGKTSLLLKDAREDVDSAWTASGRKTALQKAETLTENLQRMKALRSKLRDAHDQSGCARD